MKYSVAILALAAAATAQKIDACDGKAQPCIDDAIAESGVCEAGDEACACENMETIQAGATSCVLEACGGASEALEVVEEVKAYCASLPEDGGDGEEGGEEEPTDGGEEEPSATDGGDDAEPTDGGEEPEPTDGGDEPSPSGEEPEEPQPSDGGSDDGTAPVDPPQGAAGALAPMGGLLAALFAFAL